MSKKAFTQTITNAAIIQFHKVASAFVPFAVRADIGAPGYGEVLDKLIMKYGDQLTMEDFFPDRFTGNELKQ